MSRSSKVSFALNNDRIHMAQGKPHAASSVFFFFFFLGANSALFFGLIFFSCESHDMCCNHLWPVHTFVLLIVSFQQK